MNQGGMERRLFPRKLIRTKVFFEDEFGEALIWLYAENISLGGLFLASDIPIKINSYVFLSFYLPETKIEIRATGQVVRIKKPLNPAKNNKETGIGIRFVGLSKKSANAIQEYIS